MLPDKRKIWGQEVYLAGLRLLDGELLIVATDSAKENAMSLYGLRWEIETLFGCLKSKGFNFEDTHMVDSEKISKLLVLLSVGFCWAYKTGEWQNEQKPIPVKKHGRKAQSWFRYGLDYLSDLLFHIALPYSKTRFRQALNLIHGNIRL